MKLFNKNRIKSWWYTKPNQSDNFFVHIRELFQSVFKCNHEWIYTKYERKCSICNTVQYKIYSIYKNEYIYKDYT